MASNPPEDPRPMARLPEEAGVMPVVRMPRQGLPPWAIGLFALLAAILLFVILDSRRRSDEAPVIADRPADSSTVSTAPPPLILPRDVATQIAQAPPPQPAPAPAPAQPRIVYVPQPYPVQQAAPPAEIPMPVQPPPSNAPTLVYDAGTAAPAQAGAAAAEGEGAAAAAAPTGPMGFTSGGRARAGVFANRATTVPQGTLIPAVLETALDSTRPGMARAIVSHDVRGFDGSRVLIPRGSRLIGEYRSEAAPGQKRALVNWTRLIRPDGATIAIGSQAGDPLGRGGIRARVNTHFWERFAGAVLQTALDVAVNLAASEAGGTVVVVPGASSAASQLIPQGQVTPTLRVRAGTSISIFVARDLDFTSVETRP